MAKNTKKCIFLMELRKKSWYKMSFKKKKIVLRVLVKNMTIERSQKMKKMAWKYEIGGE